MKASFDAPRMVLLTKYCKNLRELQLRGLGMIGESLITALPYAQRLDTIRIGAESQISLSTVQSVFNICGKTLVDVSFLTIKGSRGESQADQWPKAESVKFLSLKADKESCLDIHGLRDATPNVTTVTINDWKIFHLHAAADLSTWTSLESLDLTNTQLGCLPKLPPTLRHLILSDNIFLNFSQDNDEEPTALPLLETFACDSTQFDASIIKIITAASIKAGNLKRLSLGRRLCQCLTPVEGEYPPSETLEELSLSFLIIGDQRAVQVASLYPKLRRLDVSGTKVTGVAVRQFVDMGITWLGLNECEQVGPDAVEWARGKGVEVSFNFPSRSANMRNARFRDLAF
jgi:F-box/TPR repeat protein Pof3